MADEEKNQENIENDVPLMTSEDPLECFEIECDEDETDCTKCCACELEEINFCAKPCGHLMCTFCIEEDECLKCHTKVDSKFALFFELSHHNSVLRTIDFSGIFRFCVRV